MFVIGSYSYVFPFGHSQNMEGIRIPAIFPYQSPKKCLQRANPILLMGNMREKKVHCNLYG